MIGLTMCSGIGAPEMAAPWVDWRFASEIEPFPREVLRQRFGYQLPEDHNQGEPMLWGDMTQISPDLLKSRGIPLPDLVVAGTPCQAFSVAGARKGLADARGNLTLKFVEILHAIVAARPDGKLAVLWENVPGVLSDKGNAFGCFLGGLVGAMDAIEAPAGGTWPSEGMVEGPRARLAWGVLDAQWFGVAQRRRRVFVVVDFGGAVDPAAVLLEPDCLRGNSPPSRQTGQISTRGFECGPAGGGFTDLAPTLDTRCKDGPIRNQLGAGAIHCAEVSSTLNAAFGSKLGLEDQHINGGAPLFVAHSLREEAFDASEDGTGRGTPIAPVSIAENQRGELRLSETMAQLTCGGGKPGQGYSAVFAPVAFDCKGTQVQYCEDGTHPTLRSMGHNHSHQNAGGHAAIATPWAVRRLTPTECARLQGFPDHHTQIEWRGRAAEACPDGPQYKALGNSMAVPCISWILDRIAISATEMKRAAAPLPPPRNPEPITPRIMELSHEEERPDRRDG